MTWEPSPEAFEISRARAELLTVLAEVGGELKGDHWVLGQRVRYLGDTGRWEEALDLTAGCEHPRPWWCHGLKGYVLHRSGRVVEALDAFSQAIQAMPPERASDWNDPGPLLDYPADKWISNPERASPTEAMAWFWTMADPLFLTPGNEGLSEHFSRRFAPDLYRRSSLTIGLPWGRAFEELVLRYGFVAGWERSPAPGDRNGLPTVIQHRHPESRGLLPPFQVLSDPSGLKEGEWIPEDGHPRNATAPVLAPLIARGRGLVSVLRRDSGLLILATYGLPEDSVFTARRTSREEALASPAELTGSDDVLRRPLWEVSPHGFPADTLVGLFLIPATGDPGSFSTLGTGGEGFLQLSAPPGSYLLSLEQWSPRGRWGSRIRQGIHAPPIPPDVPHLSDLILLEPAESVPTDLGEAIPRLLSSARLGSGESVSVAWEVYGLPGGGGDMTFDLSLVGGEGNFFLRTLRRIGLFRKDPALSLSWGEGGPTLPGPFFRAVELEIPDLDVGEYELRLEMRLPNRSSVVSSRPLVVF